MELTDIVVSVLIGVGVGCGMIVIYAVYLYHNLKARINKMVDEVLAEHEASMIGLDVEIDNGVYFCYNNEDKQFVCQGATVGEIATAFRDRFPTKTAYLAGGEPAVVEQFKTELLKLVTNEPNNNV